MREQECKTHLGNALKIAPISQTPRKGVRNSPGPQIMFGERQPKRNPCAVNPLPHLLNMSGERVSKLLRHRTDASDKRGER